MNMSNSSKMYQTNTEKLDRDGSSVDQSNLLSEGLNARDIANNEFGQVSPNVQLLVTPTPKLIEKSKLTKEDA